jgi:hypothetical protein
MQRERHAHLLWLFDAAANRCNALSQTPAMIINSSAAECGHAHLSAHNCGLVQQSPPTNKNAAANRGVPSKAQ